jgi:hypothetical protein
MVGADRPQPVRYGELAVEAAQVADPREGRHLVYDDLRRRTRNGLADGDRVQAVHDHRFGAHAAQLLQLGRALRRTYDTLPLGDQLRDQPATERTTGTGYEDVHAQSLSRCPTGSKTKQPAVP